MLTSRQCALVRDTWALVAPIAPTAAALFYDRLFELDPGLRPMFAHTDMREQHDKLMRMLGVAVAALDRLDTLAPVAEGLGRRHATYGVRDAHYATVGAALIWTLEHGIGDAFTTEARDAWTTAYTLIAGIMRTGAAGGIPSRVA